jgi:ribosomal protein L16 Arg81 hydroxylase
LLLQGASSERILAELSNCGAERKEVESFLGDAVSHPLFQIARTEATRLRCRHWYLEARAALANDIDSLPEINGPEPVSRESFLTNFYRQNRPVVMRGIAADCAAVRQWNGDYLKAKCGSEVIEVMVNRATSQISEQNTSDKLRKEMRLADFVDLVFWGGPSNDYYMVSRNRFFERPGTRVLLEDLPHLSMVNTRAGGDGVKMWFGPEGTITPLHYDDRNNIIIQILGRKDVQLCSPYYSRLMAQTRPWYAGVDPIATGAIPGIALTLEPGDALFIPVGWWHAVKATDPSITIATIDFGVPNEYPF